MQKGQVARSHVVEVDLHVLPPDLRVVALHELLTVCFIVDNIDVEADFGSLVEAIVIFPGEQVDAHDAENQPEDETHQQDVHDGGDSAHQGVHHHLQWKGAAEGWREGRTQSLVSRRGMAFLWLLCRGNTAPPSQLE